MGRDADGARPAGLGPQERAADGSIRAEVERVVPDERGRAGQRQVHQPGREAPLIAVRVHGAERQPGGVRAVRHDRGVLGGQHEAIPRGVGRHADRGHEPVAEVAVDAQLGQVRTVDEKVGEHRGVSEVAESAGVRGPGGDVVAVHVDLEPVTVGGDHGVRTGSEGRRAGAEVPEEDRQDHGIHQRLPLRAVERGTGLGHPEGVKDAGRLQPVPDPPAAVKRRVVDPGPAEQPGVTRVGLGEVVHLGVQQRLLGQHRTGVPPSVGRRPVQCADGLADHVRHAGHRRPEQRVAVAALVVVVGEHVLGPAVHGIVDHRARGLSAAVELVGELARLGVQGGVVRCLVRPGGPHDHRGPAAVADHHVVHVLQHELLPRGVAHVAPAGRLLPDHDAEVVTGVEEVRRLRVVRAAHHVAVQLVLQDLRVPALQPGWGGHADVGEELVPVQAKDRQPLPVEVEAIDPEYRLPEPGPDRHRVRRPARRGERHDDRVQLRHVRRPQRDVADPGDAERDGRRAGLLDRCR